MDELFMNIFLLSVLGYRLHMVKKRNFVKGSFSKFNRSFIIGHSREEKIISNSGSYKKERRK